MDSQKCVNCQNKKPINMTNNRLVIESCGHVKCMDCLLQEKSGCVACFETSERKTIGKTLEEDAKQSDLKPVQSELTVGEYEDLSKKIKPETSHIKVETDEVNGKTYVCTVCKKKFHARSQVAYHAYCNGQRKPYQCPECYKSFASHSHFKYHMRVHRNERIYSCDVCGDSFFQMSKLQRHKLKHTKEKKYQCTQCNKGFNNQTALRNHSRTHTEERPFGCVVCGRRFRDVSNYRKHVAKHEEKKSDSGEGGEGGTDRGSECRAHKCPRCPQAFHSNKDMRRHAAVHTDSKPFRCKVCNRHFRRKDNLERHIRNTHPDHVTSTAVDCDQNVLKQITSPHTNGHQADNPDKLKNNESTEKSKIDIPNSLPLLSQEGVQKEMKETNGNVKDNKKTDDIDKSYIIEANNARQSVIVAKCSNRKPSSPIQECEYVHKIRKANSMASQKDIPLPPIDEKKLIELQTKTSLNNLDVGAPPAELAVYKKILCEERMDEDDKLHQSNTTSPEMHWRRKMKLHMNW